MCAAAKSCSSPQTQPGGGLDIWQDLVQAANSSAPGNTLTPAENFGFFPPPQRLCHAQPHLFLPGIFSILELSEAIGQRRLDHLDGLGLLHPLAALAVIRQLCQPENTKGANGRSHSRGEDVRRWIKSACKDSQNVSSVDKFYL